jgi:hypothetical protein
VAPEVADGEAAGAAVEVVRLVDTLVRTWQDAPPSVLRAGGLGVRDLHRAAQALEVDDATAASVVELAATAGLVDDDGDDPPSYVPTTRADDWDEAGTAERWAMLAAAWASGRRMPWLAGTRDEKGTLRAALGSDLGRGWVPRLRAQVLTALASLGPVAARPSDVAAYLAWRTPRAVPPDSAVAGLLAEAALLGVTGAGSLAATGRALLSLLTGDEGRPAAAGTTTATRPTAAGTTTATRPTAAGAATVTRPTAAGAATVTRPTTPPAGSGAAPPDAPAVSLTDTEATLAATLRAILPPPVDELLLQGDLTGVVPGRPSARLASLIERATDVESRGAATTVRFTPASVTRALDAGTSAGELLEELAELSRTPVPQALDYLVRDTERRHAALRVGAAGSYVRAADPAVLTGLVEDPRLADLGLIRLAPTVIAAAVPAAALQAALRQRGLLAALEGPDGRPLGRLRRPARIERGGARALRSPYLTAGAPSSDAERRALVERLRIADGEGRRSPFASTAGGVAGVSVAALDRAASSRRGAVSGTGPASSGSATGGHTLDRSRAEPGTAAPGDALALLRDAVREGGHVWLELVDGQGRPIRRRVRPLRVEAGRLRALDTQRGSELTVAVHRIAAVDPDDD